jgi:polysaccharide export outer membrane protein
MALSGCVGAPTGALDTGASTSSDAAIAVGQTFEGVRVVASLPEPDVATSDAIKPNDVLDVKVFQVADLDRTVTVDDRGVIALPLIGQIQAAGQTTRQLEAQLRQAYGGNYLQNPEISVIVKDAPDRVVTMEGEFRKPGPVPVTVQSTLLRSIATAGGLTDIADENKVIVSRNVGGQTLVASYSVGAIRSGAAPDPRVFSGDIVVAFASGSRIALRNLREILGLATSASSLGRGF